jgi:hypothetical protein
MHSEAQGVIHVECFNQTCPHTHVIVGMISYFSETEYLIPRRPHPRPCFFKQAQFQGLLGDDFLQRPGFLPKVLDLATGRSPRGIPGQPSLAGLQELLRPV